MDVSIWVESWREGIKHSMKKEPTLKKVCVAGGGFVTLLCCLLIGGF
jgi:hypothetical protein